MKTTKTMTILLGVGVGAILLKKWLDNKPLKAGVVNENAPVCSDEPCSVCANVEKVHRKTRKCITKRMVREWSKLVKQGVTRKDIAQMYDVSLVCVNKHLASVKKKTATNADMKSNKFKINK